MKNVLKLCGFLLALVVLCSLSSVPWSNSTESYSPMFNLSSVYYNVPTQASDFPTTIIDTTYSSLNLTTAKFYFGRSGRVNADTSYPAPLNGQGKITFAWQTYRASHSTTVNPMVVATLKSSIDGINFDAVAGVTSQTLIPTSANVTGATALHNSFQFLEKGQLYYQLSFSVVTDTAAITSQYYFLKNQYFSLSR